MKTFKVVENKSIINLVMNMVCDINNHLIRYKKVSMGQDSLFLFDSPTSFHNVIS